MIRNPVLSRSAVADSAGNFVFADIPVGRYNLQATGPARYQADISDIIEISSRETWVMVRLNERIAFRPR